MVFKENFVAVIMTEGKILREHDGSVELPFGSDYSIRLKNLESRKAQVKVSIDGEDAMSGRSLILAPNGHVDLEGFMDGHTVRKRFRFIQKTQEIVEHRGDKVDDGIVRVEYCFEQRQPEYVPIRHIHYDTRPKPYWIPYWNQWNWTYPATLHPPIYPTALLPPVWKQDSGTASGYNQVTYEVTCDTGAKGTTSGVTTGSTVNLHADTQSSFTSMPNMDEGITVPGGETYQHFDHGHVGTTDPPHVITIKLRGIKSSGATVKQPVGTRDKVQCPTCGRKSNINQRFCGNCGTNLG